MTAADRRPVPNFGKASICRHELLYHGWNKLIGLERLLLGRRSECLGVRQQVAVDGRRQLDADPYRLCPFPRDRVSASAFLASLLMIWFEHEIVRHQDPNGKSWTDGKGRLDVQGSPNNLLTDLAETLRGTLADGLGEIVLTVAGPASEPTLRIVDSVAASNSDPQCSSTWSSKPA